MASQPPTSPLTAYATRIAHDQLNPGFVKHLQTLAKADPTFQDRLNAEVARITKGIEAKQNSGPLAIAGQTIEGIGNPLEWLKGAVEGAPQVVKGIGKAAGGNVGGGLKQAGMGAVGVAGILPVGRLGKILTAAKDARTAEEAAAHIEEASKAALAEGHGVRGAGGRGQAPKVQPGEITPETGGELGGIVRGALKGGTKSTPRVFKVTHDPVSRYGSIDNYDEMYHALPNDGEHLYHATSAENLKAIKAEGLKPGKVRPGEPTGVYFAQDGAGVMSLRPGAKRAGDVMLRVKNSDVKTQVTDMFEPGSGLEEHVSPEAVPAEKIEYLGEDNQWHSLTGDKSAAETRKAQAEIQSPARGQQVAKGIGKPGEITPETGGELGATVRAALSGSRLPTEEHLAAHPGDRFIPVSVNPKDPHDVSLGEMGGSHTSANRPGWLQATAVVENGRIARLNFGRAYEGHPGGPIIEPPAAFQKSALKAANDSAAQTANQARAVQAEIQSAARGQQVVKGLAAREKAGGGLAGHLAERAAQRGDLPTVYFDNALRNLDQGTFEQMIRHVQDLPTLKPFEQGKAVDALTKLAEGKVPAKHEQAILERAFGKETSDSLRLIANSKGDVVRNVLNVPRALMSTLDFSAPFRQGLVTLFHNPKVFGKAFVPMFKAWLSEDYFQKNIMDAITSRPTYPLMDKAGVPFTDIGRDAKGGVSNLNSREEAFMSNYAERLPLGIGKVVRASDRAYVGFLDLIRADSFDKLAQGFAEQGYDLNDKELLRSMGDFIGAATGRGNLPALQAHTATLNALLFSPRLMMSRLNFLGFGGEGLKSLVPGSYYMSLHPAVRVEAWKSLIRLGVTATMILKMANMGGLDVVADPTNADFGKLKVGNTRFDILGGFQQYIRLGAELAERKVTSSTTGKVMPLSAGVGKTSISDILKHFFEGKLSPVPSALATAADQEDFTGAKVSLRNPKTLGKQIVQRVTPFMAQDIYEALTTPGVPKTVKIGGPFADVFGIGMQSYAPKLPKVSGGSTGGGGFDFGGGSSGFDGGFGSNSDGGFGG